MIKKYAICYNPTIENASTIMKKLEKILLEKAVKYTIYSIDTPGNDCDFVFVIGGDGTILKAARYYSNYDIPIFGINLGHLGFLSQAGEQNLNEAVSKILNNTYRVENRLMLNANSYNALNDFVIKGQYQSRASEFVLEIDGKSVCNYFADGIIVCTPTGSTAYGMAAGGPVLTPDIDAIAIVPICPHTFAARPIVVGGDSKIKIKAPQNESYTVSADGQEVFSVNGDIEILKSNKTAKLALLGENDFYKLLKNKLHWGISPERKI